MSHIADSSHDAATLMNKPRPFKSLEQSKSCWESRKVFYACLDKNNVSYRELQPTVVRNTSS